MRSSLGHANTKAALPEAGSEAQESLPPEEPHVPVTGLRNANASATPRQTHASGEISRAIAPNEATRALMIQRMHELQRLTTRITLFADESSVRSAEQRLALEQTLTEASPEIERAAKMGRGLFQKAVDFVRGGDAQAASAKCRAEAILTAAHCLRLGISPYAMADVILDGLTDPSHRVWEVARLAAKDVRPWATALSQTQVDSESLANRSVMDGDGAAFEDLCNFHVGVDCLERLDKLLPAYVLDR